MNRSSIGWLKLKNVPGMTRLADRVDPVDQLVLGAGPWSSASGSFRRTQVSVRFTPAGSRPISGRPIRLTTVRISSGKASRRACSSRVASAIASFSDVLGGAGLDDDQVALVELRDELAAEPERRRECTRRSRPAPPSATATGCRRTAARIGS